MARFLQPLRLLASLCWLQAGLLLLPHADGVAAPSDAATAAAPALRGHRVPADAATPSLVGHVTAASAEGVNASEDLATTATSTAGMAITTTATTTATATTSTATMTTSTVTTTPLPVFSNSSLYRNSSAPLHTFYMYRAVSDKVYPPENVNTGSLAGVLWYLHNEVVHQVPRKFGISRIVRYKVQTRATQPLWDKGMNFGVRFAFDGGQCTGPFECVRNGSSFRLCAGPYEGNYEGTTSAPRSQAGAREWGEYGYFVGCNNLGHFPFPTYPVQYPGAVWYSLPGPCNSRIWSEHDEQCKSNQPGGYCPGTPTGQGNCTWNYEDAGEISVDELAGIPDYQEFLSSGRREYDKDPDRGFGFTWWDSLHDRLANEWRLRKARELFARRYPHMANDTDLEAPPCDFEYHKFYEDPGFSFFQCHTATKGEKCYSEVIWAMEQGIYLHPQWYPGLKPASSFEAFQGFFFETGKGECHRPACLP